MSITNVTTGIGYATLSAAITASQANDVIQISAGTYVENFPDITHNLTIESLDGLAYLSTPSPTPENGRAVLNVPGDDNVSLTISGLAISGAVDAANNGAGILFETGNANLTVTNSWFYDNQEGILTGGTDAADPGGMNIAVSYSEFNDNGVAPSNPRFGYDHNIYVNDATSFIVTNSYFHDALGGHEIKSRALTSIIENNRIQDGPTAPTSYSIDLSDGGVDTVSGNVIEKGASAVNKYMVDFGAEGTYANSSLSMTNNTLIDDRGGAVALLNDTQGAAGTTIPATIENNILYNSATDSLSVDTYGPPYDSASGNVYATGPAPVLDTSAPFQFPPCFAAGTRIETERGWVRVETLKCGDRVIVAHRPAQTSEVIWLGHRSVDCRHHPNAEKVWPVRVRAHAVADAQPRRDLFLSPDHAVFISGVLIPVRYLIDGRMIAQQARDRVEYWHVELARHDVLLADGLPCESFLDTGNRAAFANGDAPVQLYPDFAARVWDAESCAPIVVAGPKLAAVRAMLRSRWASRGAIASRVRASAPR
jgi:hypothetical protein